MPFSQFFSENVNDPFVKRELISIFPLSFFLSIAGPNGGIGEPLVGDSPGFLSS